MNPIMTLETSPEALGVFGAPELITTQKWSAYLCASQGKRPPPFDFRPVGDVYAQVNHGRWIVRCPHCSNGAMVVSRRDPLFWCPHCEMKANHDWPMSVIFPRNADDIEHVLALRPDPATRNWFAGERIDDLIKENAMHGVMGV